MDFKKEFSAGNISNLISDAHLLSKLFVVLIFFENLTIYSSNKSLLDITINPSEISLKPFVYFLVFLGSMRLVHYLIDAFILPENKELKMAEERFTAFLLCILCLVYSLLLIFFPSANPFSNFPFVSKIYQVLIFLAILLIGIIWYFFSQRANIGKEDEKSPE